MNTSLPLLNVITGSQAATGSRSGNPADSFSADVPFNQVLNSQVNTRVQDNQAQARQAQQNAENHAAAKQAAANQSAAAQQSQNASANAGAASKSAAGDGSDKSSQVSDKDEGEDSTDTTTQASAELLALVANIAQNAVTPADGKAKGESSEADLLAQAKRGGKMSLADQQQALVDEKQGKVDPAALQDALATARSKQDAAASELASKRNAEANPAPQPASAKDGKAAIDLGAAAKAEPKDDASALSARAQLGKAAPEVAAPAAKQDAAQATPTPVVLPAVQTVAASQPQAVFAPAYSDKIQSNVGSAGWNQALGTKITWMATAGMQSASLSLNPPDLGPMQVVLNVHNQQADATFITAQPEVKQALEAAMPKLREMMDQAGIQLGQANVQTGMPNHQQGAGSGQQQARSGSPGSFSKEQEGDVALSGTTAASATTSGLGLVDTFA